MRFASSLVTAAATVLMGAMVACSTSSSSSAANGNGCNLDPTICAAGTTCWPVDATPTFSCVPSQPAGQFHSACDNSIGVATCADGLACDARTQGSQGLCTFYCDINRGKTCPVGYTCRQTHVGSDTGPTIQVCRDSNDSSDSGVPIDNDAGGQTTFDAAPDAGPQKQ